ncbi:MAG TPA: hypothetical protein VIV12_13730 [Streptosporangiaceae bacterium]
MYRHPDEPDPAALEAERARPEVPPGAFSARDLPSLDDPNGELERWRATQERKAAQARARYWARKQSSPGATLERDQSGDQ